MRRPPVPFPAQTLIDHPWILVVLDGDPVSSKARTLHMYVPCSDKNSEIPRLPYAFATCLGVSP